MESLVQKAKPRAWAITQNLTPADTQSLWQDMNLAFPFWEGSGKFVEDVSGLNLHPYEWGAGATWINGELGSGVDFNGTSTGLIRIADPPANYLDGCSAFTVEFWLEADNVTGYFGVVGKYRATTGYRAWRVYIYNGNIEMQVSQDGTAFENKRTTTDCIAVGTLYHVVVRFNAGVFTVHVNGVSQAVQGNYTATACYAGTDYFMIGRRYDSYYLDGRIYGVRFWQRAISLEEIALLYDQPFRQYEPDFDMPSWAVIHAGSTPAGPWGLVDEVDAGIEELYISGLENGVSYDVYCTTVDLTGNESDGCTPESATPAGGTGGAYAPLHWGTRCMPAAPRMARRYR